LSQRVRARSGLGCSGHSINAAEKTVAGCRHRFVQAKLAGGVPGQIRSPNL